MTRKELFEGGWIDQYVLGLTSEEENHEVERLANLYPEVQEEINKARERLCSSFNRNLTQPALRHALLTKRNVLIGSALIVSASLIAFAVMCKEHFSLQRTYQAQCSTLEKEQARSRELAVKSQTISEQSRFINARHTERIKLRGCEDTPEAEVVVYKCVLSGKMMMRVIDLPVLPEGQHFEVWAHEENDHRLVGQINPPVTYDSLYILDTVLHCQELEITAVDPMAQTADPVCLTTVQPR